MQIPFNYQQQNYAMIKCFYYNNNNNNKNNKIANVISVNHILPMYSKPWKPMDWSVSYI